MPSNILLNHPLTQGRAVIAKWPSDYCYNSRFKNKSNYLWYLWGQILIFHRKNTPWEYDLPWICYCKKYYGKFMRETTPLVSFIIETCAGLYNWKYSSLHGGGSPFGFNAHPHFNVFCALLDWESNYARLFVWRVHYCHTSEVSDVFLVTFLCNIIDFSH